MTGLHKEVLVKKIEIEKEFEKIRPEGAKIDVTPVAPDKLDIEVTLKDNRKMSKRIHFNEDSFLRRLFRLHSIL